MSKVMTASDFVKKVKNVAQNYKTLYVMGCFGAPMTSTNKKRYTTNHDYNKQSNRTKLINAAATDTFGFDCVGLIKGVLWGWNGDKGKTYGGATYKKNGVSDIGADYMIQVCSEVSTNFATIEPGEVVWCKGHIGVYIGNGLAVECTPAWKNCVQITAVRNIGTKNGYAARSWTKHGKLPYIKYDEKTVTTTTKATTNATATKLAPSGVIALPAKKSDKSLTGNYQVTASSLNIRLGAGTKYKSLGTLPKGTVVSNYGYYDVADNGKKWLYVKTAKGVVGYCSAAYLKKK